MKRPARTNARKWRIRRVCQGSWSVMQLVGNMISRHYILFGSASSQQEAIELMNDAEREGW